MNDVISLLENYGLKIISKKGNGETMVLCPLHNDIHASLSINIYTGKYNCFSGCIKGNSIEDLIFDISGERIFVGGQEDTQKWLKNLKNKFVQYKSQKEIYPTIPCLPLAINNLGEKYLTSEKRKLSKETIKEWNLLYNAKNNSIIIPFENIGYIERFIDRKEYKYALGTKINKSLFGFSKVSENFCFYKNIIVLVEGSFDVIYLHQLKYSSLGILHSDISVEQIEKLRQIGNDKKILLMLDSDDAGISAMNKIAKKLKGKFLVYKCILPKDQDPNSSSSEDIRKSIKEARII